MKMILSVMAEDGPTKFENGGDKKGKCLDEAVDGINVKHKKLREN